MKFLKTISLILFVTFFITQSFDAYAQVRPQPQIVIPNKTPVGYLDEVTSAGIARGWAYDPDAPSVSIPVHFYIDKPAGNVDNFAGDTTANLVRSDVNSTMKVSGNHGFEFSIPSKYRDGKQHTLYAYGIDTTNNGSNNAQLTNVKTFTGQPAFVAPIITSLSKNNVEPGSKVIVYGTDFMLGQTYTAKITSAIDGKVLSNVDTINNSAKGTEISFNVPNDITTGNVNVRISYSNLSTGYYGVTNSLPFTITAPVVPPVIYTKPVVVAASTPTISELDSFDQNSATVIEKTLTAVFNLSITAGSDDMQFSTASSSFGFKVFRNGVAIAMPPNIVSISYPATLPTGAINYSTNGFTVPKNKTVIIPITYKIIAIGNYLKNGSFPSGNYLIQLSNYIFTVGDSFSVRVPLNNIQTGEVVSLGGNPVTQTKPVITSLSSRSAFSGDIVVINGSGFMSGTQYSVILNDSNSNNTIQTVKSINTTSTSTSFIVPNNVPSTISYRRYSLYVVPSDQITNSNLKSDWVDFIIKTPSTAPILTSVFPTSVSSKETPITITGANLSTATSVFFYNSSGTVASIDIPSGLVQSVASTSIVFKLSDYFVGTVGPGTYQLKVSTVRSGSSNPLIFNIATTTASSTPKKISIGTEIVSNFASMIQGATDLFKTLLP